MTGLDLSCHVEFRRSQYFGSTSGGFAVRSPGRIVNAGMGAARHELVVGRMKFDLVASDAAGIEGPQFWGVLVGEAAPLRHRRRSPMLPELGQFLLRRSPAVGRDRLCQRLVDREQ